jgi:Ca2+-binding RTX toxin-like protein
LGDNLENLILTGSLPINGTGNTVNNTITGNSGNNTLNGGDGDDSLVGGTGNDSLVGGLGNDSLNGGVGSDTLVGSVGNDSYTVDNVGDVVTENLNEGTDTVTSSVTYTLGDNLENLILTSSSPINGTGNALNNTITGNSGNNILNGGLGNDTLIGGLGNDSYTVDSSADVVTENLNEGTDIVNASSSYTLSDNLENLTLTGALAISGTGNSLNNLLTGNTGANTLIGSLGNDSLNGGTGDDLLVGSEGNDTLTGGTGLDKFSFSAVSSFNALGIDTLTDFAKGSDLITLSQSLFSSLSGVNQFVKITTPAATELTLVGSSSGLIVYNSSTGNLFYNPDGTTPGLSNGGQFAILTNKPLLASTDFVVL